MVYKILLSPLIKISQQIHLNLNISQKFNSVKVAGNSETGIKTPKFIKQGKIYSKIINLNNW